MQSIRHFEAAVEHLLTESCPDLAPRARRRLLFLIVGVLLAGSLVLRRIAITHAHLGLDAHTQAASHERRLRRLLHDTQLTWATSYARSVRRVLQKPKTGVLYLIIDESGHSDVVRVLTAALFYRGRALPLAWVYWRGQSPHPQSYWQDCAVLLERVKQVLPQAVQVVLLADRAFGCAAFTDLVRAQGWDFIVRVQGQTRLRQHDGTQQTLRSLLAHANQHCWQRGEVWKKAGWRSVSVAAYWRNGCREPLLLVSSLPASASLVRQYRLRSAIEAMFRDWKSYGWQWEASQVRQVEHYERLLLGLAYATLLVMCLGEEAAQQVLAQGKQQGQRRPWAARDSVFGLGRQQLWRRLWRGDTSEIGWELAHADAPSWSFECWRAAAAKPDGLRMTGRIVARERKQQAAA
jgi:hypothetical protein